MYGGGFRVYCRSFSTYQHHFEVVLRVPYTIKNNSHLGLEYPGAYIKSFTLHVGISSPGRCDSGWPGAPLEANGTQGHLRAIGIFPKKGGGYIEAYKRCRA